MKKKDIRLRVERAKYKHREGATLVILSVCVSGDGITQLWSCTVVLSGRMNVGKIRHPNL